MTDKPCPICGGKLGRNKNACSMKCYSELKSNQKQCVVCGGAFYAPPSSDTITCSIACSKENRRRKYLTGPSAAALEKAHEVISIKPLTGPFETHMHAKEWVIQSPDGEVHKCRNLKLWLRDHAHLLDGTVQQAWDGISKIKYSLQGKRKRKVGQWKGWRLLEWGD